ncbi:gas vesicle protein GvpN [bacterium]|nr:gas vesicle protein GvpN [bacterium]
MHKEMTTLIEPRSEEGFVETPYIKDVAERALACVEAGFPIHFRGVSGTGKTTLAMHVASIIGRPVVMIHGDEEFSTSDLVGGEYGYRIRKVVDNFIHSVLKTEEDMVRRWMDNRLTIACKYGFTLIYDEFTRSRAEANNILLSVLQEKMMDLPSAREGEDYLKVDPNFTAIFTSNPEEYAGVHKSQDALRDRMITLDLDHFDKETECAITAAKADLTAQDAERIINVVRGFRELEELYDHAPTVRAGVMIAKVAQVRGVPISAQNPIFKQICADIISSETSRIGRRAKDTKAKDAIIELVDKYCKVGGQHRIQPTRAPVDELERAVADD